MKLILVTGLKETEKSSIVEMVLDKSSSNRRKFKCINFDQSETVKMGMTKLENLKDFYLNLHDELEKNIVGFRKEGFNLIVEGNLTLKTDFGYIPLITDGFFKVFRPDIIVIMENYLKEFLDKPRKALELKEQQEIDRGHAAQYSAMLGIPLKIIKVSKQNISKTMKDLDELIKSVVGD